MKPYRITFKFPNLDNSLYTKHQASFSLDIEADDYTHAYLLAERLKKVYGADDYEIDEKGA